MHKSKGITTLITWRREAQERCSTQRLSFKGRYRTTVNEIDIRTISKATLFLDEIIKYSRSLENWRNF